MNIGLTFREFLTGAYQIVQEELDQLIAGIQGSWLVDHKTSGEHGSVTADSLTFNTQPAYTGTILGDFQINTATRWLKGPWLLHTPGIATDSPGANQNNYDPPGLTTAVALNLNPSTNISITGIKAYPPGISRFLWLTNRGGANTITLVNESSSSDAAYRFALPDAIDFVIGNKMTVGLFYNAHPSVQRWSIAQLHPATFGCRVYKAGNQSIPDSTPTAVQFDTERYDTASMHDTSANNTRITLTTAGRYHVGAVIQFAGNTTGYRQVGLRLNGSTLIARVSTHATLVTVPDPDFHVSTDYNFAINDYVEVVVFQSSGGALNVLATGNLSPEAWAHRIGS